MSLSVFKRNVIKLISDLPKIAKIIILSFQVCSYPISIYTSLHLTNFSYHGALLVSHNSNVL